MKPSAKTAVLAVVAAVLLALNLLDTGTSERLSEQLPTLSAVPRAEATRIEVSSAVSKVVMEAEQVEDAGADEDPVRWMLTAPITGEADQQAVKALLASFRKEVPLDVKVDEGNLDEYGLDATNGVVVELWQKGSAEPDVSFTIGYDAPGGTSFVRLSGDDAVYRARVGGRHRYDRSPAEWRNRVLLDFDKDDAAGISTTLGGQPHATLVRGDSPGLDVDGLPLPGPWALDPDPGYPTDQLLADAIASSLGSMRAGDLLGPDFEGGFDPPAGTITVTMADGSDKTLEIGQRTLDGAAYVRLKGLPDVYQVAGATIRQALSSTQDLRDKTLMRFTRQDVDTLGWQRGSQSVLLQQDLASGLWTVIQPDNVDLDVKLVYFAVNTLASLRSDEVVEGVSLSEAGLTTDGAQERIVVRLLNGQATSLEIGATTTDERGRTFYYVRRGGDPQLHLLREPVVTRLRAGFGQG